MSDAVSALCPRCGKPVSTPGACPQCLLRTGISGEEKPLAERIFQAALAIAPSDPSDLTDFISQAAAGDAAVIAEVQMLLQGYAEAGGDDAAATLGGTARGQWAAVKREEPGTVIDHFRLVKIIGEGGMGSVWEAEQSAPIRRRVALKIIKLGMDTEEVVKRFERERRTLALMAHPHIAQVYEAGATPAGRPYFAMELVEGTAITQHCTQAGLALRKRLALFLEVCAAVEHAHQKGVIHRDLKPSNILVADGAVKVIDFGIAKATQESSDGLLTMQAQVLGTPAYMSPEQAESNGADVDTRTDVYSLGVVLYELLSGALPFDPVRLAGTHLREVQRILREEEPPRPSTRAIPMPGQKASQSGLRPASSVQQPADGIHPAELRNDLDWIVMKALSKERERRYASAAAFAADVRRFLAGEAVSAVPPTLAYRFGKFVRRNKTAVAATVVVLLALAAGLVVSLMQVQKTNEALTEAQTARTEATHTVADMYARSGLSAAENGDPTRAALWFANAAIIGAKSPQRVEANRLRAEAWRGTQPGAVRAFDTGFSYIRRLQWHPALPAVIVEQEGGDRAVTQIWDIDREARWRPDLEMEAAAWSPDGKLLAASLGDRGVILEYPSGSEVAGLPMVSWGLCWSPDGRWISTGAEIVDWRTGETRPMPPETHCTAFNRDGSLLLLNANGRVGVSSFEKPGTLLHEPVPVESPPHFLGDGSRYAVCTSAGELRVHDSRTGTVVESFPLQGGSIEPPAVACVSPDGRFVALRHHPVIDLRKKEKLTFPRHAGAFKSLGFSPDGSLLASGGYDDRMELWSALDGRYLGQVGHHHSSVGHVEFAPDGRRIASVEEGLVRIWDTRVAEPALSISASDSYATLCAVSDDGRFMVASGLTHANSGTRSTCLRRLPGGEPAGPDILPGGDIMDAVIGPQAAWLALAVRTTADRSAAVYRTGDGGTGNVQFWNPHTGQRLGEPVPLPSEPRGLSLHPSAEWLGICCAADGVELHTVTRQLRHLFRNSQGAAPDATLNNGRCGYSPDGRVFAAWGTYKFIRLWDRVEGRDLIEPFHGDANAFDLAFHGSTVAIPIVSQPMRVEFRDLRTGAPAAPALSIKGWPFRVQFSGDGSLLLTGSGGHAAEVWDWRAGHRVCPALPHDSQVMAGLFVPGTPWVITGSLDSHIRFWDRRTGMMIRPPVKCSGWVLGLQITPDARTLIATGFFSGKIELYDMNALLPAADLSPERLKLRAEIDANAEVHPGGGLAPLSKQAWLEKWREWRAGQP